VVLFVKELFVIVVFDTVLSCSVPFVIVDSSQFDVCRLDSVIVQPLSWLLFTVLSSMLLFSRLLLVIVESPVVLLVIVVLVNVLFVTVLSCTVPLVIVDSSQELDCAFVSVSVQPDSWLLFIVDCVFCELVFDELRTVP